MIILPKAIFKLNAIPMTFFTEVEQVIITLFWIHERPTISKTMLREKNKAGCMTIPDFRKFSKATVIKTALFWHKNGHKDSENKIETTEVNPNTYRQLPISKRCQNVLWKKDSLFSKYY